MSGPCLPTAAFSDPALQDLPVTTPAEALPMLVATLRSKPKAPPSLPLALVNGFHSFMKELRPVLVIERPDLVGFWIFVTACDWKPVCSHCSIAELIEIFVPSQFQSIGGYSFICQLGTEFQPTEGGQVAFVGTGSGAHRFNVDILWEFQNWDSAELSHGFLRDVIIDTGADDVLVCNYQSVLESSSIFPIIFHMESGPSGPLFPSMSIVGNPKIAVAGQRFLSVPRIVIPFDLFITWNLWRCYVDPDQSTLFHGPQPVYIFEPIPPADPVFAPLMQWLGNPFSLPTDKSLQRFLLSIGISMSLEPPISGLLGLSYLLQTDFNFSKQSHSFIIQS